MPQSLVVSIPAGQAVEAKPTGIVFNGSSDFVVSDVGRSGPARFIFAGQAGTLAAWSPGARTVLAPVAMFRAGRAGGATGGGRSGSAPWGWPECLRLLARGGRTNIVTVGRGAPEEGA